MENEKKYLRFCWPDRIKIYSSRGAFDIEIKLSDFTEKDLIANTIQITRIFMNEYQQKGIGTFIFNPLTEIGREFDFKYIEIACANSASSKFSESLGMTKIQGKNNYVKNIQSLKTN